VRFAWLRENAADGDTAKLGQMNDFIFVGIVNQDNLPG